MATPGEPGTAWSSAAGPDDSLRPFTSTSRVPAVADPQWAPTGPVPRTMRRRPAPLALRLATWTTALLVVGGLVVIGLHRAFPSWFRTTPSSHATSSSTPTTGRSAGPGSSAAVVLTPSGATGATVTVDAAQYTVEVSAQAPCWVDATSPASATPLFEGIMKAGDSQTFRPAGGKLALNLGASHVTLSVLIDGKSAPAWQWTPTDAPYQLSFVTAG